MAKKNLFTSYEKFVIAILASVQFTVIMDFMVLAPLGTIVMDELTISPSQFALVVSAYAASAGISGLLSALFADKFDRKRLLLFFYIGFILGTLLCAIASNYEFLLMARIVTGIFGGVMSSISYSIITDLFPIERRGTVMGFIQTAFATSQILGIPVGFYLAIKFNWHVPFYLIVVFSAVVASIVAIKLKPIIGHLSENIGRKPLRQMKEILGSPRYLIGLTATVLLSTGGYMLMPFGSDFANYNLGIDIEKIPMIYVVTGIFSFFAGPIFGRWSDKIGKFKVFFFGTSLTIVFVAIYTNLGITPLWLVIVLNVVLFIGINARIVASSAMITAVPEAKDRGAYMSINSSVQSFSGAIASMIAGLIVVKAMDKTLLNYPLLGMVVIATMIISMFLMRRVHRMIQKDQS
jgi:predicted MFS family arabinose efflux permease